MSEPPHDPGDEEALLAARLHAAQAGQPTAGVPLPGPERDAPAARADRGVDGKPTPARPRRLGVMLFVWIAALVVLGLIVWLLVD